MGDEGEADGRRPDAGISAGRLLTFSDGVFAIAFTVLVLDLDVPDGLSAAQLRAALNEELPHVFSALLSFAVIGRFWIAHHKVFEHVTTVDTVLLVLNTALLAPIALIPFGATLLAEYGSDPSAFIVYATTIGAAALFQLVVWLWVNRRRRIAGERLDEQDVLNTTLGLAGATAAFLLAIPVALVSTTAAPLCWLLALVPTDRLAARIRTRRT